MDKILEKLASIEAKVDETKAEIVKLNNTLENVKANHSILEAVVLKQQTTINKLEHQLKKKNLIFTGITEEEKNTEELEQKILRIINKKLEIQIAPNNIEEVFRLGTTRKENYIRPVLVSFSTYKTKREVLNHSKKLKGSDIYINLDLTSKQLEEKKQLLQERKRLKAEGKHVKIIGNKLIIDKENTSMLQRNDKRLHSSSSEGTPTKPNPKNQKQVVLDSFFRVPNKPTEL